MTVNNLNKTTSNQFQLYFHNLQTKKVFQEGFQWITPYSPYLKMNLDTQTRKQENKATIYKYGQLMFDGNWNWFKDDNPIVLFWNPEKNELYCGDGHHRIKAAQEQFLHQIYVEIKIGTLLDAKIYNCTCNGNHGKPTTNEDKRNQIRVLLNSLALLPEQDYRRRWSDRKIAGKIGVDHKTVGKIRRQLAEPENESIQLEKKETIKKQRIFYNFRKLICESDRQELNHYLQQIEPQQLSKLKSAILRLEHIN